MSAPAKPIEVHAWLNDSDSSLTDWYYPAKPVDLSEYDEIVLISRGHYGDLFAGRYRNQPELGRLFRGNWNSGRIR